MFKSIFTKVVRKRSETVLSRILPYIKNSKRIVDIGSGTGDVAYLARKTGKNITPVDVADFHGPRLLKTLIYDGKTLPFKNKQFDTALLLMVMHHTPDPKVVFKEAARVAKNIIVIETSYASRLNRFFTIVWDAIGNLHLNAFWNSYKSDEGWRNFFKQNGFNIVSSQKHRDKNLGFIPFLHILYFLQPS